MRLRAVAGRLLAGKRQPPRTVTWLDMLDVFGPSVLLISIGYRAFLIAGFALWRPAVLLPVAVLLIGTFVYRMLRLARAARAVRRILTWCDGADGTVVSVPKRGPVAVQVGDRQFSTFLISRGATRPKVGQRVGVAILRGGGTEAMYLG